MPLNNSIATPDIRHSCSTPFYQRSASSPPFVLNTNSKVQTANRLKPDLLASGSGTGGGSVIDISLDNALWLEVFHAYTATAEDTVPSAAPEVIVQAEYANSGGDARGNLFLPGDIDEDFLILGSSSASTPVLGTTGLQPEAYRSVWRPLTKDSDSSVWEHTLPVDITFVTARDGQTTGDASEFLLCSSSIFLWIAGASRVLTAIKTAATTVEKGMIMGRIIS